MSEFDGFFVGGPLDGRVIRVRGSSDITAVTSDFRRAIIYRNTDGPFFEVARERALTEAEQRRALDESVRKR